VLKEVHSFFLRVLEDRSFFPVGAKNALQSDCRIITATNANLQELVDSGKFRKDIYFRINTVEFTMPPLRKRKEDIMDLANYYMDFFNKKYQKEVNGISEDAKRWLVNCKWTGNMRELNHVIERAVLFTQGDTIDMDIILKNSGQNSSISEQNGENFPYRQAKRNFEISYFQKMLDIYKGNIAEMAQKVGLERTYIYRKLRELNL
jgi:transcriptional regulator with PAS, ATPase and Fis domain